MRIGILLDRLIVGGVEKIALEEVHALREAGHSARLIVLRRTSLIDHAFSDLLKDLEVDYLDDRLPKVLRFSINFPFLHFFSMFHITYPLLLPFVVRRHEYDYIIAHGTYTCLSAIALKKRCNIGFSAFIWDPVVYIIDRVYRQSAPKFVVGPLRIFGGWLDKYLIKNMDSVLVGGIAHNAYIKKIDKSKQIHVIYPSVKPIDKPLKKEQYILVATAWKRGKAPEYLLSIADATKDLHIKMAGKWIDPQYREEFKSLLAASGHQKQIEVLGEVSEEQMAELYAKALFVLQTNDDRGFGLPALEAAGRGTAFIIPEGQGVCALFTDGVEGFYTREKDTAKIVAYIQELTQNPGKAVEMGKRGLSKVKTNYTWQNHAAQLIEVAQGGQQ